MTSGRTPNNASPLFFSSLFFFPSTFLKTHLHVVEGVGGDDAEVASRRRRIPLLTLPTFFLSRIVQVAVEGS